MSDSSLAVDEILEDLELLRAAPGLGFLERVFLRFNERVPFENVSKIVRDAEVRELSEKPRRPEVFWREHLELGAGGTCFARVAAFEWLISELGFHARPVLGRVESDFDHAALLVALGAGEWICDVGFPLPALLPASPGEIETVSSTLAVSPTERGLRVDFRGAAPLGPAGLEIFTGRVPREEVDERWRQTFRSGSKFLSGVYARKTLPGRVLSFARGELRIDDRHSRARAPLPAPRPIRFAELFDLDRELVERAFAIAGDPEPEIRDPRIDVFLETACGPDEAYAAIGSSAGYSRLMKGVGSISVLEEDERSWRLRIGSGGELEARALEDRVAADGELRRLSVWRGSRESSFAVEVRNGRTFLIRGSRMTAPIEELLRNDSVRGRLAGTLALDLLAWARLL
jgi:hypothetical protein